jgi:hypothetical protein
MARFVGQPEKQAETVDSSVLLGLDSPETIGFTDLSTLGMTGVQFSQGVVGGGVSGGGDPGPAPDQPAAYAAMCVAVVHDPAAYEPGHVQPNGVWVGELRTDLGQAQFDVSGHDDLQAYLCRQVGTNLVGPYSP